MALQDDMSPFLRQSILEATPEDLDFSRWQSFVDRLARLFSAPVALINQANERGIQVIAGNTDKSNPYRSGDHCPPDTPVYCRDVINTSNTLYVPDGNNNPYWSDNPELTNDGMRSYLGVPLQWPDGSVFGTLCIMDRKPSDYGEMLIELLQSFKDVLDYELQLIDTNRKLRTLSLIDSMTGLYNRRGLIEASRHLIAQAGRHKHHVAVLYLDIDDLKPVNDRYGHDAGDLMIKMLASTIGTVLRGQDIAARLGGDEFAIIALIENENGVDYLIERLTLACAQKSLHVGDGQSCSLQVSIGSAVDAVRTLRHLEELLDQADAAMYDQKSRRRKA